MPSLPEVLMRTNDMAVFKRMFVDMHQKMFLTHDELECYKYTFGKAGLFSSDSDTIFIDSSLEHLSQKYSIYNCSIFYLL